MLWHKNVMESGRPTVTPEVRNTPILVINALQATIGFLLRLFVSRLNIMIGGITEYLIFYVFHNFIK